MEISIDKIIYTFHLTMEQFDKLNKWGEWDDMFSEVEQALKDLKEEYIYPDSLNFDGHFGAIVLLTFKGVDDLSEHEESKKSVVKILEELLK